MLTSFKKMVLVLVLGCCLLPGMLITSAFAQKPGAQKPGVNFNTYLSDVQRRVTEVWSPLGAGRPRTVVVDFKIHQNGTESHLRVGESSGDDSVDSAALKTINEAAPFKELPEGSPSEVDVEIAFHYDVVKDKGIQLRTVARMPGVNPQLVVERRSDPVVDFGPYMAQLQRRIKHAWYPPKGEESRRIVVVFKIDNHGKLSHLRLDKPSGAQRADRAALRAVEDASPFNPLPQGSPKDVDVQFTFDYNVFGGASSLPPEEPPTTTPLSKKVPVTKEEVELNNEGVKAINADDLVLAIKKLERAVQRNPGYILAKENLAIAYNNNGLKLQNSPTEALDQFHKSLYVKPDNATTLQNLEGIIDSMGKNPKSFKDRVGLAEDALSKNDKIGGFIEYQQALSIREDPVVRAKFDEVARALDRNYRPVAISGDTSSARATSDKPAAIAAKPASNLFTFVPGWALMLTAMAVVFAVGLYFGNLRQNQAVNSRKVHRSDHEQGNT